MALWHLHLRPIGRQPSEVVEHCLADSILGLGWGLAEGPAGETRAAYLDRHQADWGKDGRQARSFLKKVKRNDLIWARDAEGGFLLGRVDEPPHPRFGQQEDLRGLYHVAPCTIVGGRSGAHPISDTEVPGRIKANFTRPQSWTFHQIHEGHLGRYSAWLFATKTGTTAPPMQPAPFLGLLDPFDLEDLVALYMQEAGWRVVLSSHTPTTPRYEATFVHPDLGTAGLQVKQLGVETLRASDYAGDTQVGRVFLFAASGSYGAMIPENVIAIAPEEIVAFAKMRRAMLPASIRYWFDISIEAGQTPDA